jgi:surface protein
MKSLKESLLGDMEAVVNNNGVYYPKNKDELIENIISCLENKIYDLNCIDTSEITEMSSIFDTKYGPLQKYKNVFSKIDISKWNVSNVENMSFMFIRSQFNGDISKWNVSKVKDMSCMFKSSQFNGDISKWNTSNVEYMGNMFEESKFNKDISKWDVSNVKDMSYMFYKSNFNGNLSKWDVRNVENMSHMFYESDFNGDISKWDVKNVKNMRGVFDNCPIEEKYKPKFN